jgi:class 3 adenylate cyclase
MERAARRLVVKPSHLEVEPADADDDSDVLELVNDSERVCTLLLERRTANAGAAHGTDILTLPEFLDLYGTEAPASGVDLTIGRVAVLFSDLTNTTVAYRSLGDARAFALIHEHFREMGGIVAEHAGAILKTMGDAVMASFVRPGDAVRAGLAMIEATRQRHGQHGFHLKVGIHDGPCVMVRANQRMDLFGTTVNIASRLQEQARADQLVLLASLVEHAEVAAVLDAALLERTSASTELKGLGDDHQLVVLTVPTR